MPTPECYNQSPPSSQCSAVGLQFLLFKHIIHTYLTFIITKKLFLDELAYLDKPGRGREKNVPQASVAQLVERVAVNHKVACSNQAKSVCVFCFYRQVASHTCWQELNPLPTGVLHIPAHSFLP